MNWNPDQVLLDLHIIQIRYYSLMFVIAFSLGFYIMKKIFLAEGKSLDKLDALVIYVALATCIFLRLGLFQATSTGDHSSFPLLPYL